MRIHTMAAVVLAAVSASAVWAQAPASTAAKAAAILAADPRVKELDDLIAGGMRSGGQLATADVMRALELGVALGRPHAVGALAKAYLARDPQPPAPLLRLAAECARLTGEYRVAVTRQKQYVRALPAGVEASEGAAVLYRLLSDMDSKDEAFVFMKEFGEPLRASARAKKYDAWFIQMAWERRDIAAVARWLALCMRDQAPLEFERLAHWGDLDRLIDETRIDNPVCYDALPFIRQVAALIRESPVRRAQLQFQADHQYFCAGARGKSKTVLVAEFAPVAASAKAWFDAAPSGATLAAICSAWSNGGGAEWEQQWARAAEAKADFFKQMFGRLSESEKTGFFRQSNAERFARLGASSETWLEIIRQTQPTAARNSWAGSVEVPWGSNDHALHKAAAPALAGVLSGGAAVMRSLGAGDDYRACLQNMSQNESWFINRAEDYRQLTDLTWSTFSGLQRDDARKLQPGAMEQALASYATEVFFRSPLPLMNREMNRDFMNHMWAHGDKSKMVEVLHMLDWVPLSDSDRALIYNDVASRHRSWSEGLRRQRDEAARKSPEEAAKLDPMIALIEPIGQAIKQVTSVSVLDMNKAPSQLCQQMARLREAAGRKDRAAALAAARAAYALLRDYEEKKTPFGRMCLREIVRRRPDVEMWEFQVEALGDQLALSLNSGRNAALDAVLDEMQAGNQWIWAVQGADRNKLEAVTSKAAMDMLNAGKFSARVFDIYRQTRLDNQASREIMTKLIEGKVLVAQPDYRLDGRMNAATTYQWLLEREFPWMNEKYPRDRYFDDMFAEEVVRTKIADPQFWQRSADTQRKGANAVCAVLKTFSKLPFGYDGAKPVYGREDFWSLSWNAVGRADEKPRQEMLEAVEAAFGTTRFDDYAIGRIWLQFAPGPSSPETRRQFFERLVAFIDKVRAQGRPVVTPSISAALTALKSSGNVTDAELAILRSMMIETQFDGWDHETVLAALELVNDVSLARKRTVELLQVVPSFWVAAGNLRDPNRRSDLNRRTMDRAVGAAEASLLDLAATYSTAALSVGRGFDEQMRKTLETIRSKSLVTLGGVIPVDRGDRRYPIYAAQLSYLSGQYDPAWDGYAANRELVVTELKNLDPLFVIWLVEEAAARGDYSGAENLAREMIATVEMAAVQMSDNESRARLFLAQANIALARQDYPLAKSLYERIALAKEFEGTRARATAEVKVGDVERLTRDYAGAIQRLEGLLQREDSYIRTQANYMLALVKYDQDEWKEAKEYLNAALQIEPSFAEALILEGKLNIKLKKLMEATRVQVGISAAQRVLEPGRPLTIRVEDRNLSVVGASMGVEVRVWSSCGDEEFISLRPFGDSKTRFEGQIGTELNTVNKGDRMLQVLGGSEVRYDFSERFKEQNKITTSEAPPVIVMTDPDLFASSGVIYSREELAEIELERMARARAAQVDAEAGSVASVALSTRRSTDQVKPGNPIRIRVLDPDRSTSDGKDRVRVRAVTTSGDSVSGLEIEETGPFAGVFDGELKTGIAPATAFASDSNEGADPNFAVSGGDYPPWVALTDGKRPKAFSVDLNDNIAVRTLAIQADVPARRLKSFSVQTSLNGRDFETVGLWPDTLPAWNGSLRATLVRGQVPRPSGGQQVTIGAFNEFLATAGRVPGSTPPVIIPASVSAAVGQNVMGQADRLGLSNDRNSPESWYLIHVRGGFYLPQRSRRSFRANVKGDGERVISLLAVDGKVAKSDKRGEETVTASLGRGVHLLDFYLMAQRGAVQSYSIEWDIKEPPFFGACPDAMFDVTRHPQITASLQFTPAVVVPRADNSGFDVDFATNSQARVVRLGLFDFEGDAPALRRLTLVDARGRTVLPTKQDLLALRKNDILETMPGDNITITYEDPTPITQEKRVQEAKLSATFYNANLRACFVELEDDGGGGRKPYYIPMRRFRLGDPISVFINDPDCDVSDEADKVKFKATTSSGASVTIEAIETSSGAARGGDHTGVFLGRVFTVAETPKRPADLRIGPDDDIQFTYGDVENTDYGIPWDRSILVEQAGTNPPSLRVYDMASILLPEADRIESPATNEAGEVVLPARGGGGWLANELMDQFVPARRAITVMRRDDPADASTSTGMILCTVPVEITWPAVALSPLSKVRIHLQTGSSRQLAGVTNAETFDPQMPGTLTLETGPSDIGGAGAPPPGYKLMALLQSEVSKLAAVEGDALDQGLFSFSIPLQLGEASAAAPSTPEDRAKEASYAQAGKASGSVAGPGAVPPGVLAVRPGDEVVIGFEYPCGTNETRWVVRHCSLRGDALLDVMDKTYRQPVRAVYMGEKVCLRVIDPTADKTGDKDVVSVQIRSGKREPVTLALNETFPHTGVFRSVLQLASSQDASSTNALGVLPVDYGDSVVMSYVGGSTEEKLDRTVKIAMGSDGSIQSFTKRFKDPSIAVQTQFTVAESYFELAKNHRALKQEELARREIAQGRKLLEEAIRDFPQTEARAQAEYLLAELSLELAQDATTAEAKKKHSADALQRYIDIVVTYPDSPYAPKAQFKKGMTLEKLGQIDDACEEYVKLSYKHPDSELVAETIARLGQYFLTKGKGFETQIAGAGNLVQKEKLRLQSVDMFKTAAQVFGRLAKRFPDHQLAAKTTVLSGQCWMRAADYERAVETFRLVTEGKRTEPELVAEAMYWCGDAYMKDAKKSPGKVVDAYRMFKKLTWDYPESQWAKYARGRLTDPVLAQADSAGEG